MRETEHTSARGKLLAEVSSVSGAISMNVALVTRVSDEGLYRHHLSQTSGSVIKYVRYAVTPLKFQDTA